LIRARDEEGNIVTRAYTPITKYGAKGSFDMIIKTYPNGFMSKFLDTL
jgi:hypothetical protein